MTSRPSPRPTRARRILGGAAALALATVLGACGGGDDSSSDSGSKLDPKADLTQQSVTVVRAGTTNVLSLPE